MDRIATNRRAVVSWCLFDWAGMPFHSVINTFVFAVYFSRQVYGDETGGSAAWAYAVGLAGFVIAIASPIFGAIADHGGRRKLWLGVFTVLNLAAMAGLWFVTPQRSSVDLALVLIALASIGSEIGLVFYNAMLPGLVSEKKLGRLSGFGWGLGYLGGLTALGLVLVVLVLPDHPLFGIPDHDAINLRITAPLSALWLALFAWPLFAFLPDTNHKAMRPREAVRQGMAQLGRTLKTLPQTPALLWFLIASALYRDALTTLFTVGGQFAAGTFGMDTAHILYFAIGINITAVAGCFAFGWLDDRIGSKTVIMISLVGLLITGAVLVTLHDRSLFIPIALVMGLFMGPAQSSGRTLMARLTPPHLANEMFGLYQLTGKSAAFIGPLFFATATDIFHSQRIGMATILVFILAGLVLMRRVKAAPSR